MNKVIQKIKKLQARKKSRSFHEPYPGFLVQGNISGTIQSLPASVLGVLDYFLRHRATKGFKLFMSQETIAKELGCCRQTVNEALGVLTALGFIRSIYRHMHTSLYKVSSYFDRFDVRKKLGHLFAVLTLTTALPFFLLFHPVNATSCKAPDTIDKCVNPSLFLKALGIRGTLGHKCERVAHVRERAREEASTKNENQERIMLPTEKKQILEAIKNKSYEGSVIPEWIESIPFQMTFAQHLKLLEYPKVVIEAVRKQYDKANSIDNCFAWFWKRCKAHTQEINIQGDWQWRKDLERAYGIASDAYLSNPVGGVQTKKNSSKGEHRGSSTKAVLRPAEEVWARLDDATKERIMKSPGGKALREDDQNELQRMLRHLPIETPTFKRFLNEKLYPDIFSTENISRAADMMTPFIPERIKQEWAVKVSVDPSFLEYLENNPVALEVLRRYLATPKKASNLPKAESFDIEAGADPGGCEEIDCGGNLIAQEN